jgi:hypothetical protein
MSTIRQRIAQTAKRIAHLKKVLPALENLNKRRRKQLEHTQKPASLSVFGIDYAWGNPDYAALKNAGVRFVMRYVSHDPGKDLDPAELRSLHARGIKVGLVFESTANRALDGFAAGVTDAKYAAERAKSLGLNVPIYFGVDFDASDAQKPVVAKYLSGAVSVLGKDRVGVYGSYYVVRYCVNFKVCDWFWQTYAWSGGLVHPDAHILQYSNGHALAGVSCDYNHGSTSGYGAA